MVWAGISATAKTDLVFTDGNVNGQLYINEVLTHHVLPFLCQMPVPDPIFQDDNARPHRARIMNDFIQWNNVTRMAWPAVSSLRMLGASLGELCRHVWNGSAYCKTFDGF